MLLFHLTTSEFSRFKTTSRSSLGAHFGGLREAALLAPKLISRDCSLMRLLECEVSVEKPIQLEDHHCWEPHIVANQLRRKGVLSETCCFRQTPSGIKRFLAQLGFDSVAYLNRYERPLAAQSLEMWAGSYSLDNVRGGQYNTDEEWLKRFPDLAVSYIAFSPNQINIVREFRAETPAGMGKIIDSLMHTSAVSEHSPLGGRGPLVRQNTPVGMARV